jgi:L-alanine-DL-glutamate epimerase-like enolase superfamily enzyme
MNYQTEILETKVEFIPRPFVKPLQLSTGLIEAVNEARVEVAVRVDGREAKGRGNIYLSDLWAWPEPKLSHDERDAILRDYTQKISDNFSDLCGGEKQHPLELGLRLHNALHHSPSPEYSQGGATYSIPLLARAMCASPFDAALHDAVGIALNQTAFDFYDDETAFPSADDYFKGSACGAIRHAIRPALPTLDAWMIVGAKDDLKTVVAPWIQERGYRCFKLKILAQDNATDAARTVEVFRGVRELGAQNIRLSVDSNEANPNADSVLDYLQRVQQTDAETFAALEYLEQPTGRDITKAAFDWKAVTKLKPVLLDEGLTSLELLQTAVEQGWSGLALKSCKGHSFVLVAAAWAREHGMKIAMQDLTNPGLSAIHAALLASRLHTLNGVELNATQYTPSANEEWLPRLQELLEPRDGLHHLPQQEYSGLGSKF